MRRPFLAFLLCLCPALARADVTCAEMQAAYRVPPPLTGASEDPDGALGCTHEALKMFVLNLHAMDKAVPVEDLSELHGAWLGDQVLSFLLGATVPGQEVLIFAPGERPDQVKVTQYWMRAAAMPGAPLWTEDGRYTGIGAEAVLFRGSDGMFSVPRVGGALTYGTALLEPERSYDLMVKRQLNHFELPFSLRRQEDVLVLEGQLRDPATREAQDYVQTYTRIAPEAAELALATVLSFEISQGRYLDCLAHQISDGEGPLFDLLSPEGLPELEQFVRRTIGEGIRRDRLARDLRAAKDKARRDALKAEMKETMAAFVARTKDPDYRDFVTRFAQGADGLCPDYF